MRRCGFKGLRPPYKNEERSSSKFGTVALVSKSRQLSLHKEPGRGKTPTDKPAIQRQIDATDRQIDNLASELYSLTHDEIRMVEETIGM